MKFEGRLEGREIVPRPARIDASFDVLVRCAAGEFGASITNLSGTGFRLRSTGVLEPGWEILLEVPRTPPIKGVIRWVSGEDAGGVFAEAVAL
jgi:hypothetical protein